MIPHTFSGEKIKIIHSQSCRGINSENLKKLLYINILKEIPIWKIFKFANNITKKLLNFR